MTAQFKEKLTYKGTVLYMAAEPLQQFLFINKIELRMDFTCTALWRGYMGSWEIVDDKLFLTSISGHGQILNKEKFREGKLALRQKLKAGLITPSENGHLLKALEEDCYDEINLSLKTLFHTEEKVFASWYTGILNVPHGKMLQYVHLGYASKYEKEMTFTINEGIVTGFETKENKPWILDID